MKWSVSHSIEPDRLGCCVGYVPLTEEVLYLAGSVLGVYCVRHLTVGPPIFDNEPQLLGITNTLFRSHSFAKRIEWLCHKLLFDDHL